MEQEEQDRRLAQLRAEVERQRRARTETARPTAGWGRVGEAGRAGGAGWRRTAARWTRRAILVGVVAVLPVVVLLRGATALYTVGAGTWPALAGAALATFGLLGIYLLVAARYFHGRFGIGSATVSRRLLQGTGALVAAYLFYGLVFLSGANAKSAPVRAEYRSLHPLLRTAVATLVLLDSDLLITDAARTVDDYAAMGLPPNEASLHLEQADGYAHALDLRTAGRPELLNHFTRLYFSAAGFHTLRHVGTADHLHVSLPPPD